MPSWCCPHPPNMPEISIPDFIFVKNSDVKMNLMLGVPLYLAVGNCYKLQNKLQIIVENYRIGEIILSYE